MSMRAGTHQIHASINQAGYGNTEIGILTRVLNPDGQTNTIPYHQQSVAEWRQSKRAEATGNLF
jgi:hypothetical protein